MTIIFDLDCSANIYFSFQTNLMSNLTVRKKHLIFIIITLKNIRIFYFEYKLYDRMSKICLNLLLKSKKF